MLLWFWHFWPASPLLFGHLALATLSPRDRSSNFGALGLCWWGSTGQIISERRILVSNFGVRAIPFVNFTRWIGFGMSVPFRRIDFGDVMSWNKQTPNCWASENRRLVELCPNFLSLLFTGCPVRSYTRRRILSLANFPFSAKPQHFFHHSF